MGATLNSLPDQKVGTEKRASGTATVRQRTTLMVIGRITNYDTGRSEAFPNVTRRCSQKGDAAVPALPSQDPRCPSSISRYVFGRLVFLGLPHGRICPGGRSRFEDAPGHDWLGGVERPGLSIGARARRPAGTWQPKQLSLLGGRRRVMKLHLRRQAHA